MTTLVQIIQQYPPNEDGNIIIPKDKKEVLEQALMGIRKPQTSNTKKKPKQKKDPNAPKRPTSAYMIWLNKQRSEIKSTHFGDYDDIIDWTMESKCKYYESKGLSNPKEDGKPRILALVTAKAGILWKIMTSEEISPYDKMFEEAQAKYVSLKASYIPVEPCLECKIPENWCGPHFNMSIEKTLKDEDGKTIKIFKTFEESLEKAISLGTQCFGITQTKRGFSIRIGKLSKCSSSIASWTKKDFVNPIKSNRGRPKTKVEDSDDSDVDVDYEVPNENIDESGDGLEVEECVIDGKIYYKSSDGELYDPETSEPVGKYVNGSIKLDT
jgi:hypothetical protein